VSCIAWVATCNSLFIFEGTYLTSNLFLYDLKVAIMADFKSHSVCGSNAMWRTCLPTRTHASGTTTNSCNSFALNNARERNVIFTLQYSYASRRHYAPHPQQTRHPRYRLYNGLPNCHQLQVNTVILDNLWSHEISLFASSAIDVPYNLKYSNTVKFALNT